MCFIVGFLVVVLSTMAFIWLNYVRGQTQMSNNWRKCEITVYVAISPSEQEGRKPRKSRLCFFKISDKCLLTLFLWLNLICICLLFQVRRINLTRPVHLTILQGSTLPSFLFRWGYSDVYSNFTLSSIVWHLRLTSNVIQSNKNLKKQTYTN
jgi:hypothetical protein